MVPSSAFHRREYPPFIDLDPDLRAHIPIHSFEHGTLTLEVGTYDTTCALVRLAYHYVRQIADSVDSGMHAGTSCVWAQRISMPGISRPAGCDWPTALWST